VTDRVLIVTGGLVTGRERSLRQVIRKLASQRQPVGDAWLTRKVQLVTAEPLLAARLRARRDPAARALFGAGAGGGDGERPSLTEVTLATLLEATGVPWDTLDLDTIYAAPALAAERLDAAACVFLSTTYLHDLGELAPVVERLRRPHLRLVVGGALMAALGGERPPLPGVDVVAIGYGESVVPALVAWMRADFTTLQPPPGGRSEVHDATIWLWGAQPDGLSLDTLPTPDWALAGRRHGRSFTTVDYESVRGCPYRCGFCNYPYLFADSKFRRKSAQRIADDWQRYAAEGVDTVVCLDSLFTMPRQRLHELCRLLIERRLGIRWVCYARADDLDPATVALMRAAGACQVQIGIESGDPTLLANMDKACTVEANAAALDTCREAGLTSVVSLIVGFPGETLASLARTEAFLRSHPPDFYFLATFSTRVAGVPVLAATQRARFELEVADGLRTMAPYWRHATMSAADVGNHVRHLDQQLIRDRVALNAALFHRHLLAFDPALRADWLAVQASAALPGALLRRGLDLANSWVDRRLARAVESRLPSTR
jgi:hypothetical protein